MPALAGAVDELATRIERDGLTGVTPADLRLRLRAAGGQA